MECNFRVVITFIFLFEICAVVEVGSRHISVNSGKDSNQSMKSIDCFSPNTTMDQLKAFATVKCSENNDRQFWESACNCTVNNRPESECPKCRSLRNAELGSVNTNTDFRTTVSSTTEDNESINKKLRLFQNNTSIASNSANFIRFGR